MGGRQLACAFCREPIPREGPDAVKMTVARVKKRAEAGDARAIRVLGQYHIHGECGLPRNVRKGSELCKKSAKLGDVEAHYQLAVSYEHGDYGLSKDIDMALYHYKVA